jgi:cytochrome c biogenesis protein CcmG/thiol:disulfide interchange protein DsbE
VRRTALLGAAVLLVVLTGCGGGADEVAVQSASTPSATVLPPLTADPSLVASSALEPCPSVARPGDAPPHALPDLTLPCLGEGPSVALIGLRDVPNVVNVWATWCAPCRDELPYFQALHATAGDGVRVLGVLYEDEPDGGLTYAADLGLTFPSVLDAEGELKAAGFPGLPATFFVDVTGAVVHKKFGVVSSEQELRQLVGQHLGVAT